MDEQLARSNLIFLWFFGCTCLTQHDTFFISVQSNLPGLTGHEFFGRLGVGSFYCLKPLGYVAVIVLIREREKQIETHTTHIKLIYSQ